MRLRTKRLLVRPRSLADTESAHSQACREEVFAPAGFLSPRTVSDTRKNIRRALRDWKKPGFKPMVFSLILRSKRLWIGGFTLRWPHAGVGEIGYNVHPEHWGQGYATEAGKAVIDLAFQKFGAHRVQANCWVKNAASIKVLRRIGLKKEGRLRGYLKRGVVVRDEYQFGMTRQDWAG